MSSTLPPVGELLQQAVSHHQHGELAEAESLYRRVLQQEPEHAQALNLLGVVAAQTGRGELAVALLRRAVAAHPAPDLWNNLGLALEGAGQLDEAAGALGNAIALAPGYVDGHYHLGNVLLKAGRNDEAANAYRRALELRPAHADAANNLGQALQRLGDTAGAETAYRSALQLAPHDAFVHNNLGLLLQDLGNFAEAAAEFRRALDEDSGMVLAWSNLAHVTRCGSADDPIVQGIERRRREVPAGSEDAVLLDYALGKLYDECADYPRAFDCFRRANEAKAAVARFDAERWSAVVDRLIETCTPELLARIGAQASASDLPVFVVGMPRSGTSLVEQIVASHPDAAGVGELDFFNRAAGWLDTEPSQVPAALQRLAVDAGWLAKMAAAYLEQPELRALPGRRRIVDKMPYNFLHLGLIAALFPRARIVHCRRDPLDTCLSIYFTYFEGRHDYTYRLADIAAYWRDYARLMQHWQRLLPDRILQIDYERLVAAPEAESRALLQFIGLDWDARSLDFHAARRAVRTRSNVQVRERLYTRSVGRWKNYAPHLDELRRALDGSG
jgi:tetratricopeptide (TPR) repeat protein